MPPSAEDRNSQTDSLIALAALVIAGVAFVTAFLQALLQYLTSAQRDKCLRGAIGGWYRFTRTSWDFSRWRIRVQYPRLTITPDLVLRARKKNREELWTWANNHIPDLLKAAYNVKSYEETYKTKIKGMFWLIENRGCVLTNSEDNFITFWELPIVTKVHWLWFWVTRRRMGCLPLAKAGWCNFLATFSLEPDRDLVDGYEDADTIPSGVDVPIQRVQLQDLCLLCYMAGIKDIKLEAGSISAKNAHVALNSQQVPGLGQVITIDGDFDLMEIELTKPSWDQIRLVCDIARGYILGLRDYRGNPEGSGFNVSIEFFDEEAFLYGVVRTWNQEDWDTYRKKIRTSLLHSAPPRVTSRTATLGTNSDIVRNTRTSPRQQAERYQAMAGSKPWEECWGEIIEGSTPTIIKYLAVMPFIGIWSAAPLDLFLSPLQYHIAECRKAWFKDQLEAQKEIRNDDRSSTDYLPALHQHPEIEFALADDAFPVIRSQSNFSISGFILGYLLSKFSWFLVPNRIILQQIDSDLCRRLLNSNSNDPTLLLPEIVLELMNGLSIEEARKRLKVLDVDIADGYYTLESAIFLALFIVDCRLQALWSTLEKDSKGQFTRFYSKVESQRASAGGLKERDIEKIYWGEIGVKKVEPLAGDFLALWFELGKRADLIGSTKTLQVKLTDLLESWRSDDSPCIPVPDTVAGAISGGKSRKEFILWAEGSNMGDVRSRLEYIREMLPLLQLRIFLMELSYGCHADSSNVVLAHRENIVNVRLI